MGNSCTLPARDKIALPSKVILVQHKELLVRRTQSVSGNNSSLKISTKIESSPLSILKEKHPNSEAMTAVDIDEELRPNSVCRPLVIKYDICELGIGEYFLQNEFNETKSSAKVTRGKKSLSQNEVIWDRMVVQMRPKVLSTLKEGSLFTQVDMCLKEFAYDKPKVFSKLLKDGPPMRYRWSVWKYLLNPDRFYVRDLYERFKNLSSPHENQIRKDIHRTFPNEPYFASKKYDHVGQEQLFNTLKAVSLYFPNVGYVQGMNFLMGFLLLLNGGNELEAFWVFVTLVRDHKYFMMGFFEKEFPLLEFYLYIFYHTLEEELPLVHKHLKQQQLPDQLWVFKWFLSIFLYSLPEVQVVRIWDFIMDFGLFGVVQITIAILKIHEKEILELDTVGMDCFLRHLRGESFKKKNTQLSNKSNTSQNANQSIINSQCQFTPKATGQHNISHNINLNNLDFENVSICNETSDFHYNFKVVNIEQVLDVAEKIPLSLEKIVFLAEGYREATNKQLPEFYYKFLTRFDTFYGYDCLEKQTKFQDDVDFYIMKSELTDKPSDEIVVSNLLNEIENNDILHHLDL